MSDTAFIEAHSASMEEAIARAMAQAVAERAANPIARVGQLLLLASAPTEPQQAAMEARLTAAEVSVKQLVAHAVVASRVMVLQAETALKAEAAKRAAAEARAEEAEKAASQSRQPPPAAAHP